MNRIRSARPKPPSPCASLRGSLSLLLVVVLANSLPACTDEPASVTLGVAAGSGSVRAAEMALSDELAQGDVPNLETAFVVEASNRSAPALETARDLVNRPGLVAVVGHANSAASLATSPVYNEAGVLQLAPTATAKLYRQAGPLSFRMVPGDEAQGPVLAQHLGHLLQEGGRIAIAYVNDDYGRSLRAAVQASLVNQDGLEVVLALPHTEDDVEAPNLDHLVEAMVAARPDAVVWLGRVVVLDWVLDDLRTQLGDVPVVGGDGIAAAAAYSAESMVSDWTGVHYAEFLRMDATEELVEFDQRFRDRWDEAPSGSEVLAYDAVRLLIRAFREGARTGPELRDYLLSLGESRPEAVGLSGSIRFTSEGDRPLDFHMGVIGSDWR